MDITTIGQLAARPVEELVAAFGPAYGAYLANASRGVDNAPLRAERVAKSISAERTFGADTADRRNLWKALQEQAEEVAGRLRAEGLQAGEVAIKLRYADWQTLTRQKRLDAPSDEAAVLAASAAALMRRHWDPQRAVRLIGLRAGHLLGAAAAVQLPLLPA
jgi:DNA polymerase IV